MCGLIVSTDPKTDRKDFEKGLACLNDRGPDDAKIVTIDDCLVGFARLSIMDLSTNGMQPFDRDGFSVVCNGELYDFRKCKGYISKMVNSRNRINEKIIFLHVSNTEEICDLMHSFLD